MNADILVLVAAMVAAAVIPALNIPLYPADTVFYPLPLIEAPAEAVLPARDAATAGPAATGCPAPGQRGRAPWPSGIMRRGRRCT